MKLQEIIAKVKELGLPEGSYVVFGSCPLAAAGLREAGDIDMLVTTKLLRSLEAAGWKQVEKGRGDTPFVHDVFEAHDNWDFSHYRPTLAGLLMTATVIDGVPFASLEEVRKWKAASGRPKDLKDIELIDACLAQRNST